MESNKAPVQCFCLAYLGTVFLFVILQGLMYSSFHSLTKQFANQQKEIDELQVILENIFQNSIRIFENSTDVTDVLILRSKKNEEDQSDAEFSFQRLKQKYLAGKATYNSAYFVIDPVAQDGHMTFDCRTQPRNTAKEIRCWKQKVVPGTKSIHHDFCEFNKNGTVRVTKNGFYKVFTQLTFVDSGDILADNFKSGLFKNFTQFSLNIGQVSRSCVNPDITFNEHGQRYRTCYIDWTGPLSNDQPVYIGSAMGKWTIKHDEKYSFWGITKLDSWIKDA